MSDEVEILREQLRVKDEQIERLQHIIENLTQGEGNEEDAEEEPEPHVPTFWERHPRFSYAIFGLVFVGAIAVCLFPIWWKSLWIGFGNSAGLIYTFSSVGALGLTFLCWLEITPAGKSFLDS